MSAIVDRVVENTPQSQGNRRANWARWGWLVTTLTLAAALVLGAWVNYRGVVAAVATLNRGQADLLEYTLREVTHPGGREVDVEKLQTFLDEHRSSGLRFVAVVDPVGRVVFSAGEPASPLTARPSEEAAMSHPLISVGGRIRAIFPRPPLPGDRKDPAERRSGVARESGPPPRFSYVNVLEFEPVAAGLVARAERTFLLAGVGAAILTLAAVLFWRTSQRYENARLRIEEQRRLSVLGEMSAVLAHEIRNPLASLKGHAQLLLERLPKDSFEGRKADRVVEEAKRLEVLTSDLLDFARSGPMDLRPVDPVGLLRAAAADFPQTMIAIDGKQAPDRWLLDERRFRDAVLVNLLRNALQASPADRPPEGRVLLENGGLVFTIRDFGPGLPAGEEERIFDPFFTTRTTGTGLGLPLARRIVELHGGRIVAANAQGAGAVFRIELPRQDAS